MAAEAERATPAPLRIAVVLFPGMTALDVVGPQVLLASLAGPRVHLVAERTGPVASDTGLEIVATVDFETCPRDLDVLMVPGGDGTPDAMGNAPSSPTSATAPNERPGWRDTRRNRRFRPARRTLPARRSPKRQARS